MSNAQVHYLDADSPPRVLFSGEQLLIEHLPAGTRVIYPKPPIVGLKDPDAAIRYALNHPLGMDPLHAQLFPGETLFARVGPTRPGPVSSSARAA